MATKVPAPVLDTRNGDLVTAQAISALPPELSDRSNANAAVVIVEACGTVVDKLLYQNNQWPTAVMQKELSLIGVNLIAAAAATTPLQYALSSPQTTDVVIPKNSQASINDGSITFATLADLTITAYTTPPGTAAITSGSTAVVGSGTAFVTGSTWVGWQIQIPASTGAWYTIASVTDTTHLTLTTSSLTTTSGAFNVGAVTGTTTGQATVTGSTTNVAAGTLTTLGTSPSGVASVTNPAAATGGIDIETTTAAITRAPTEFSARDVALSATDYATFAQKILGTGGRAFAQANTNGTAAATGFMSVALMSPAWTVASTVSTQERASVVRDMNQRALVGPTTVDLAANVQSFSTAGLGNTAGTMFACALYRAAAYDLVSTQIASAKAINTYLSPNTYPWGRTIDPSDLAEIVGPLVQVDRVLTVNGVVACGMNYTVTANNVTFTNGSTSVTGTALDFTIMTIGQTFLMDSINNAAYLVTGISGGTITISTAYTGATASFKPGWFTSTQTALTNWYSLPFSALSISNSSPPASILVVGSV